MKKTRSNKSRDTVPLNQLCPAGSALSEGHHLQCHTHPPRLRQHYRQFFSAGVKKAISLQKQVSSARTAAHTAKAISIYVFPEKELLDLNPYFPIHVSERFIYSHDRSTNFLQNRQTDHGNM
jgi:hypothetical protein